MSEEIELPNISIITPIYNKQNFFKLALHNFNSINYPSEKLEWIILDDSDDNSIKDMLPNDKRIRYYYYTKEDIKQLYELFIQNYNEKKKAYKELNKKQKKGHKYKLRDEHKKFFKGNRIPLGMKRNLGVSYATYDIIIHMDDDDLYNSSNIETRVKKLLLSKKEGIECIGCSKIGCFHISKMISIIYEPKESYGSAKKICCSSLAYTKNFWMKHKFENQDIFNEVEHFLKGRKSNEIHWKDVMVALYHSKNDRNMDVFKGESNGWHYYPLSNEMFEFITSLDT